MTTTQRGRPKTTTAANCQSIRHTVSPGCWRKAVVTSTAFSEWCTRWNRQPSHDLCRRRCAQVAEEVQRRDAENQFHQGRHFQQAEQADPVTLGEGREAG